jgi:hypothetical protein
MSSTPNPISLASQNASDQQSGEKRMNKPQIHKASLTQRIAIYEQLKKVCKNVDGFAVYEDGWNDDKVASFCEVTTGNVQSVRMELFGKIRMTKDDVKEAITRSVLARLDVLERQIEELDLALNDLKKKLGG